MKRLVWYLSWVIIIIFIINAGVQYRIHLTLEANTEFVTWPYYSFLAIFPILIGILLRLPQFILEIKSKQPWTFDWLKLLVIGLPALYVTLMPLFYFLVPFELLFQNEIISGRGEYFTITAGIVFGFVLLDSLKKDRGSYQR
ncbi:hypothetical protein CEY16_05095 [Halalkalibacillus sediminis]|uniref:Uncharacterized protein n=1 Tax=Halalkalibacillus sediminis TaxID=2018042 RepID=A0A2I0QYE1_9BACI|nr:hypothetical protein [Halalkalibacillus sediminis]PKR79130.1 hypothetical protein CEY16_05095 [Halalkalibacillus sediminis]